MCVCVCAYIFAPWALSPFQPAPSCLIKMFPAAQPHPCTHTVTANTHSVTVNTHTVTHTSAQSFKAVGNTPPPHTHTNTHRSLTYLHLRMCTHGCRRHLESPYTSPEPRNTHTGHTHTQQADVHDTQKTGHKDTHGHKQHTSVGHTRPTTHTRDIQ